jgi:hypothetical protein
MTCECRGRQHLVCKTHWAKIDTARRPRLNQPASATTHRFPSLGQAIGEGLQVMPHGYYPVPTACRHGFTVNCPCKERETRP